MVNHLQEQYKNGAFEHLALVASPEFLGVLRALLSDRLKPAVSWEINKDYTQFNGAQLSALIAQRQAPQ